MQPIQAFLDTFNGVGGTLQSGSVTFSFGITAEFEAWVPIRVLTPANVSAGAEVYIYRSNDGGATFETEGNFAGAFPLDNSANMVKNIHVETGQYLIEVMVGGGSSASYSAAQETAYVITAYE